VVPLSGFFFLVSSSRPSCSFFFAPLFFQVKRSCDLLPLLVRKELRRSTLRPNFSKCRHFPFFKLSIAPYENQQAWRSSGRGRKRTDEGPLCDRSSFGSILKFFLPIRPHLFLWFLSATSLTGGDDVVHKSLPPFPLRSALPSSSVTVVNKFFRSPAKAEPPRPTPLRRLGFGDLQDFLRVDHAL